MSDLLKRMRDTFAPMPSDVGFNNVGTMVPPAFPRVKIKTGDITVNTLVRNVIVNRDETIPDEG